MKARSTIFLRDIDTGRAANNPSATSLLKTLHNIQMDCTYKILITRHSAHFSCLASKSDSAHSAIRPLSIDVSVASGINLKFITIKFITQQVGLMVRVLLFHPGMVKAKSCIFVDVNQFQPRPIEDSRLL